MTTEYATIKIQKHRRPDGLPTCCADYPDDATCRFLGVREFGMRSLCMLGEERILYYRTANNGGYLQPHDACKVWKKENSNE